MPKHRYQRREPTHDWQQIHPLLKDQVQITYEVIRPVILFGVNPTERSEETGISRRTIYYKANLFDTAGMTNVKEGSIYVAKHNRAAAGSCSHQFDDHQDCY